jgi:hypothetical protein
MPFLRSHTTHTTERFWLHLRDDGLCLQPQRAVHQYFERREGAVGTGTDRVDISFPWVA